MISLQLFGSIQLTKDGRELGRILAQPKRLALLGYLAAHSTFQRRDALLALFWPELDHAHARASLNQALHFLRRELRSSDAIIVSRGDEIGLAPDAIRCDVVEFDRAFAERRWRDAARLYSGDFFNAFFLGSAAGFEEWVERGRAAYRTKSIQAALAATEDAPTDPRDHLSIAERALELAPLDERVVRRVLELRDAIGDRSGALRLYDNFAVRFHAEYGIEPSNETRAVLDGIRRRISARPPAMPEPRDRADARLPEHPVVVAPGRRWLPSIPALAALAAAALVWTATWAATPRDSGRRDGRRTAVFPFVVRTADSAHAFLGEGIVDLVQARMPDGAGTMLLDARNVISAARRARGTADELSVSDASALGRRLGAARIVVGEILSGENETVVLARLIDVRSGRVALSHIEKGAGSAIDLAMRTADAVVARLLGESDDRLASLSDNPDAVKAYLTGMQLFRAGRRPPAFDAFSRALEIDSQFAPAALWRAYAGWGPFIFGTPSKTRADSVAWSLRSRLRRSDSLVLAALPSIGPNYPEASTTIELLQAQERAARANPERAELWVDWARHLVAWGAQAGIPRYLELVAYAADSAIALDSSSIPAVTERFYVATLQRDTAAIRKYRRMLPRVDSSTGSHASYWAAARVVGDSAEMAERWRRMIATPVIPPEPTDLELWAASYGLASIADAERLITLRASKPGMTDEDRVNLRRANLRMAVLRGDRQRARQLADSVEMPVMILHSAIAEPGYDDLAARVVRKFEARSSGNASPQQRMNHLCNTQAWRINRGDTTQAHAAIGEMRAASAAADGAPDWRVGRLGLCPLLLEAMLEQRRSEGGRKALARLQELLLRGTMIESPGNLAYLLAARMLAALGEQAAGLEMIRRRDPMSMHLIQPASWKLEGELALATGDTGGAVRAFTRYLEIRERPDSGDIARSVDSARATLRRLRRAQ